MHARWRNDSGLVPSCSSVPMPMASRLRIRTWICWWSCRTEGVGATNPFGSEQRFRRLFRSTSSCARRKCCGSEWRWEIFSCGRLLEKGRFSMTPITREWVEKAEGDYAVVRRELRVRKDPNYDGVCFHSQQCVEKYLKARLQEAVVAFPKTHDLVELLRLLRPLEPTWWTFWRKMRALTNYAVAVRYP